MAVITCRHCGHEVNAESLGCPECGADPRTGLGAFGSSSSQPDTANGAFPHEAVSEEQRCRQRRLTRAQYAVAALLALALLAAAYAGVALTLGSMVWTLSPAGWLVLDLVVSILVVALVLGLRSQPNPGLAGAVSGALTFAALGLAAGPVAAFDRVGLPVLLIGAAAVWLTGITLRFRDNKGVDARAFGVSVAALILLGVLALFSAPWGLDTSGGVSSGGPWRLGTIRRSFLLSNDSSSVCVFRTSGGLFREQRVLYASTSTPDISWLDSHTVRIDSHTIDIFSGASVSESNASE